MVTQVTDGQQKGHSVDLEVRSVFSVPCGLPAPWDAGPGAPRWPGCATVGLSDGRQRCRQVPTTQHDKHCN